MEIILVRQISSIFGNLDLHPRYGDYPGKTDIKYIRKLILNGAYFDLARFRNGSEVTQAQAFIVQIINCNYLIY